VIINWQRTQKEAVLVQLIPTLASRGWGKPWHTSGYPVLPAQIRTEHHLNTHQKDYRISRIARYGVFGSVVGSNRTGRAESSREPSILGTPDLSVFMEQSPSWEKRMVARLVKRLYVVYGSLSLERNLSQFKPVHTLTSSSLKILYSCFLPATPRSSRSNVSDINYLISLYT
jgi:hypothetical protein